MNKLKISSILVLALALVIVAVAVAAVPIEGVASTPVSEQGITPYIIPDLYTESPNPGSGNRTCEDVGLAFFGDANYYEFTSGKIDADAESFPAGFLPISVTSDGTFVSWNYSGHNGLAAIVKGSSDANVYVYEDGSITSDSGLASPVAGGSGGAAALSNLTFCWNATTDFERLSVSKTAVTSYTREHFWDITKKVTTENNYLHDNLPKIWLYIDGSGDETATWKVNVTYDEYADKDFNVSGEITIENTGTLDAKITAVTDEINVTDGDPISVVVDACSVSGADVGIPSLEQPYTLLVGETLTCSYSEDVDGKIAGQNEASVTTEAGFTYDAVPVALAWGEPTTEENKTVTIVDNSDLSSEEVELGTVTAPNGGVFMYFKHFAWEDYGQELCGDYVYDNTATIVETGQTASATLKVNVQCYIYETAYAKGDEAACFIDNGFSNWGWTNPIMPGEYTWDLWAAAGQCDTDKGTLVGSVTVVYNDEGFVTVQYNVGVPYLLDETHVYADYGMFPLNKKGNPTVAPGSYYNASPFDGYGSEVYVIAHAVVGIPDPDFGPPMQSVVVTEAPLLPPGPTPDGSEQ